MFIKFANADVLQAEIARPGNSLMRTAHRHSFDYQPREGFLYVRSRAISSRTNDNFDTFPAEEIKKAWATFVGKPVFVNHHNDDHRRARGVIIDAALHEDTAPDGTADTWVEVLMEIDAINFPKLAAAILAGDIERTSMGCDVAHSTCSACGNRASTPLEYCKHIPRMKGKRIRRKTASGDGTEDVLVHEICAGLSFFENSVLVEPPADPTAYFLGVDDRGVTGMAKSASRSSIKAHGGDGEIKYSVRYKNRADSHVEIEDGQGIVEATLGGQYVGSLIWDYLTDPPEVLSVVVEPAHQRRGIATKLWEIARQNESRLSHSVALTDEGRSWARSLSTSVANLHSLGMETKGKRRKAARGFPCDIGSAELGREALAIYRRMENKTATADDILAIAAAHGRVGLQWGIEGSEYGSNWADDGAGEYAYTEPEELARNWVAESCGPSATDAEIWRELQDNLGEVMVILVGTTTADYVDSVWDAAIPQMSNIQLTEVRYDAGWGWVTLPANGRAVNAKKDTTPSEDKGNTTDRGYGWDHQKKREELLKDNPKCHWCKSAPATEADHHNNGLVPSCSKCNNERSHEQKKRKNQKKSGRATASLNWQDHGGAFSLGVTTSDYYAFVGRPANADGTWRYRIDTPYGALIDVGFASAEEAMAAAEGAMDDEIRSGLHVTASSLRSVASRKVHGKDESVSLSAPQKERFAGTTVKKDDDGYYCHTHRARSDSYPSVDAIPDKDIAFIESTGSRKVSDRRFASVPHTGAAEVNVSESKDYKTGFLTYRAEIAVPGFDYSSELPMNISVHVEQFMSDSWSVMGVYGPYNSVNSKGKYSDVVLMNQFSGKKADAKRLAVREVKRMYAEWMSSPRQRTASTQRTASNEAEVDAFIATFPAWLRDRAEALKHRMVYGQDYSRGISDNLIDAARSAQQFMNGNNAAMPRAEWYMRKAEAKEVALLGGEFVPAVHPDNEKTAGLSDLTYGPTQPDRNAGTRWEGVPTDQIGYSVIVLWPGDEVTLLSAVMRDYERAVEWAQMARSAGAAQVFVQDNTTGTTTRITAQSSLSQRKAAGGKYVMMGGCQGRYAWELHAAGCSDTFKPKYSLSDRISISADSPASAVERWVGDLRDQGWSENDVKVYPCVNNAGSAPAQVSDPNLCPASGTSSGRIMAGDCPVCGKNCRTGRSMRWPKHAPLQRSSSRSVTAYGETKAPAAIDTLRARECPVCGEDESADGDGRCRVCGYLPPPEPFRDPDLDVAQKVDMRQGPVNIDLYSADPFLSPDEEEEDEESGNPVRDDQSPPKKQKNASQGDAMRPTIAAAARQQEIIKVQAQTIARMKREMNVLRRMADAANPAQPVAEPGAQAPAATTDQTRAADATIELTTPGGIMAAPMAGSFDLTTPGGVIPATPAINQEVTAPVTGYEQSISDMRTEVDVNASGDTIGENYIKGDWANTTASRHQARTFASLRLARLRLQAGVERGDDIALAQRIASSRLSDEAIRNEINSLSKIPTVASRRPNTPIRQQAVRNVPSLVSTAAPVVAVAAPSMSPNDDEFLFS